MKRIPLTRGLFALVNDADFIRFGKLKWFAQKSHCGVAPTFYAARRFSDGKLFLLHRLIMQSPPKVEVDHHNGNTLDCRKRNLRQVTSQQNSWNAAKTSKKTSSQFKGVCYVPQLNIQNPWIAYIGARAGKTKRQYLGYYSKEVDAAKAYDRSANRLFGKFARLNFP